MKHLAPVCINITYFLALKLSFYLGHIFIVTVLIFYCCGISETSSKLTNVWQNGFARFTAW
jgi:hypothetical protein